MRFRFIATEKAQFPVRLLCRTLQVSRAGFYAWQDRAPSTRDQVDDRLGLEIAAIHTESRRCYGSPRIHAELIERGCRTSRKRVARLMRTRGLAARRRRRFRATTQSQHSFPIAPNHLARQFERATPDQAWVTDITYIWTGEGWLYLAVILDLCSRVALVGQCTTASRTISLSTRSIWRWRVGGRRRGCFIIPSAEVRPGSTGRRNTACGSRS